MANVYLKKDYQRTIIKYSDLEVKDFVNEAVEEKIEREGITNE